MAIETERGPSGKPVTRSRINGTVTACHYPRSNRVIVVADHGDFASALEALAELAEHLVDTEAMEPRLRHMLHALGDL